MIEHANISKSHLQIIDTMLFPIVSLIWLFYFWSVVSYYELWYSIFLSDLCFIFWLIFPSLNAAADSCYFLTLWIISKSFVSKALSLKIYIPNGLIEYTNISPRFNLQIFHSLILCIQNAMWFYGFFGSEIFKVLHLTVHVTIS